MRMMDYKNHLIAHSQWLQKSYKKYTSISLKDYQFTGSQAMSLNTDGLL